MSTEHSERQQPESSAVPRGGPEAFAISYGECELPVAAVWSLLVVAVCIIWAAGCTSQPAGPEVDIRTGVHVVASDAGYQLYRNGEPFEIKGGSGEGYLAELKRSGGNTMRVYSPELLPRLLDEADSLGIAIIADLPMPNVTERYNFYDDPEDVTALTDTIRAIVTRYARHPALLCWMLGNEVIAGDADGGFEELFASIVDVVRAADPNHPVSTTMIPTEVIARSWKLDKLGLDFISFNTFGNLSKLDDRMGWISALWRGPYLLAEWSMNGPWEAELTSWGAPIEPTSMKKAEQLRERYQTHIATIDDGRCLGSLAFYWGLKQESTDTWFSLFDEAGRTSEMVNALAGLWQGETKAYDGPQIDQLLLDGGGAGDNLIFAAGARVSAHVIANGLNAAHTLLTWEVKPEVWSRKDNLDPARALPIEAHSTGAPAGPLETRFVIPREQGAYRLFVTATDSSGRYATANIPFEVIIPEIEN